MKVSIVTAVLDSYEIARRQILHYNKLNLSDDIEVIFIDDGSYPPLDFSDIEKNFKFYLYATNDKRPWTQPAARNYGASLAEGDYLILTDIDHIISPEIIDVATVCANRMFPKYDVIRFKREVAVIDENGDFTQDMDILRAYGYKRKRLKVGPHGNSYIFRRVLASILTEKRFP
jgi:glycosyltransferase involved in cell wall biosynthesis